MVRHLFCRFSMVGCFRDRKLMIFDGVKKRCRLFFFFSLLRLLSRFGSKRGKQIGSFCVLCFIFLFRSCPGFINRIFETGIFRELHLFIVLYY
ncbi:Uncharacterised protein [Mycobacteroides abscessus subsp. abscessus]|nr:Uncharacterised protein [Mycobacteroides abscessus subsp. abscessus]